MTTHDEPRTEAAPGARSVVLARYRPGMAGETARVVHLIPLPFRAVTAGAVRALCGALLGAEQIETVQPGDGMPCTLCYLAHLSRSAPPRPSPAPTTEPPPDVPGPSTLGSAVGYQALGWPVTLRRDQVLLHLDNQAVALTMPTGLATDVATLLATRRCPAPVLAHPHVPEHLILLAGEPFGVPLPWPDEVQTATAPVPLPPTLTSAGPVTWVHLPDSHALRSCREIDIYGALHTLVQGQPGQCRG